MVVALSYDLVTECLANLQSKAYFVILSRFRKMQNSAWYKCGSLWSRKKHIAKVLHMEFFNSPETIQSQIRMIRCWRRENNCFWLSTLVAQNFALFEKKSIELQWRFRSLSHVLLQCIFLSIAVCQVIRAHDAKGILCPSVGRFSNFSSLHNLAYVFTIVWQGFIL